VREREKEGVLKEMRRGRWETEGAERSIGKVKTQARRFLLDCSSFLIDFQTDARSLSVSCGQTHGKVYLQTDLTVYGNMFLLNLITVPRITDLHKFVFLQAAVK
jgi:hypothetical protein